LEEDLAVKPENIEKIDNLSWLTAISPVIFFQSFAKGRPAG